MNGRHWIPEPSHLDCCQDLAGQAGDLMASVPAQQLFIPGFNEQQQLQQCHVCMAAGTASTTGFEFKLFNSRNLRQGDAVASF